VSGYDDEVADTLAGLDVGVLSPTDRTVLALVLLRTVAIPRARGELSGNAWVTPDGARPTTAGTPVTGGRPGPAGTVASCGTAVGGASAAAPSSTSSTTSRAITSRDSRSST